jgi:hypothetical protein
MKRALLIAVFALAFGAAPTASLSVSQAEAKPRAKARSAKKSARAKAQPSKKAPPTVKLKDPVTAEPVAAQSSTPVRGPTRIDFDDRLIQGQTNKSGAVYLYDRKELKTRSMVRQRESFREEIVGSVYGS